MYNEFDVVRLKELSIDATHVKVGDIGAIIVVFEGDMYEVEFVNNQGKVIEILTLHAKQIEKIDGSGSLITNFKRRKNKNV
ncbi:DUF4926 domain-containing protein [Metabacillus niabensis]|uniref:DUF4926 domain-containing protein n=1 Tax=Metabacillus niabensis TaxID=324854 RepID=A0ABT9Z269_9BACI|nr:DUF4926 domain-containing protein [Metabacillus niabensis]MDQ0226348.1 hypothetical protein [Metabacillus niabensis]